MMSIGAQAKPSAAEDGFNAGPYQEINKDSGYIQT